MDGPEYSGAGAMLTSVIHFIFSVAPWGLGGVAAGLAGLAVSVTGALIAQYLMSRLEDRLQGRRHRSSGTEQPALPWLAESLLCIFARAKDIEALMGDFEELFARDCASGMSRRRAVARYWARMLRSAGPQIWQAIKRLGLFGLIAAALRR